MGPLPLRRTTADLTLIGFILAGCVALALVAVTQRLARQERRAADGVLQAEEALQVIADTRGALVDIQNGHRGFTIEGTPQSLQPYVHGTSVIANDKARLRQLLQGAPEQRVLLAEFERLLPTRLATAARIVQARSSGGFEAARQIVEAGAPAREMTGLRNVLDAMQAQQESIFRERVREQNATLAQLATWVGGATLLLLPALAVLYAQIRKGRRVDAEKSAIAEQLRSLNESLEAQVAQRTQELRAANGDLERTQLRLQQLSARMVEHQEQERRHLAYELHEDMAQSMSAIRIDLVRAQGGADKGKPLADAVTLLDALIAQTRDMVARLRPTMLDDLGLPEALDGELAYHAKRQAWKSNLYVEPPEFPPLPPKVATACFRIAQEALFNADRHAHAHRVDVRVRARGEELELTVEDDGVGFQAQQQAVSDLDADRFGLAFMRERARQIGATLEIDRGSADRGVRVRLRVPLAA